ncbi:CoA transferase [Bradyrhizobium sp. 144]|uniref:CoA transferase n=1 Tax=Bradyrhizobium sp. 144 TaxID=2782620 RepID=UPI001FFB52C3|nr:CoA transferase [Bradyrhizobium sp. 144]
MGILSGLRVIEIGSSATTSYCARLLADFGADVQKVEPPLGDPLLRKHRSELVRQRGTLRRIRGN